MSVSPSDSAQELYGLDPELRQMVLDTVGLLRKRLLSKEMVLEWDQKENEVADFGWIPYHWKNMKKMKKNGKGWVPYHKGSSIDDSPVNCEILCYECYWQLSRVILTQ